MMYNRYIPQPDGSYRRNRMPEPTRHRPPPPPPQPPKQEEASSPPPPEHPKEKTACPLKKAHPLQGNGMDGFLRQLLPKDFDTGDLIVVLLLLLMAGDNEEGRNNALLTLVLYFLM